MVQKSGSELMDTPPIGNPRDECEIVAMFESMLFQREKPDSSFALTKDGVRLLEESGIVNHVFRYWYQLTWLFDDWNDEFSGSTFRQELSARYPDIWDGTAMLSVRLAAKFSDPAIVPELFTREDLEEAGGAFRYGLRELETSAKGVVAPNFVPGFRGFVKDIQKIRKKNEPHLHTLFRYAADRIPTVNPKLSQKQVKGVAKVLYSLLVALAEIQQEEEIEYIVIDRVVGVVWHEFRKHDKTLAPYEAVVSPEYLSGHSSYVLYHLGRAIDEYLLFPADRYFNAVEIVWQDKENFMNDLVAIYEVLNNDMKPPNLRKNMSAKKRREYDQIGMEATLFDPERAWYNPPTCFRFYPWALAEIV